MGGADTTSSRLGRDTLIYGIAFLLSRAASFIMLPVYTRYLVPADYAALHLLQMSLDVAAILLSSGVIAGVQRFYFKYKSPLDRRAVLWGSLLMYFGLNVIGSLCLWHWAGDIAGVVLEDKSQSHLVLITAGSFALEPLSALPLLLLQILQRSKAYSIVSIVKLVVQLSMNVYFVVVMEWGVYGILLSTLITYSISALVLMSWFFRAVPPKLDWGITWILFKFGFPYRVTEAGTFIMTYVDRYFLTESHGLTEVGIYSLAYQFGFLLMTLVPAPFHLAWDPQRFEQASAPEAERNRFYSQGFFYFSVLLTTLAVGICLFVGPMLHIMSDAAYHGASTMVPVIVLAFMCQAWGHVKEFGIQVAEKTTWTTVGTWISVGVIVVGYLVLIPPYGAFGAAWATVIAYATRWACFYWFSQRLFPIEYRATRGIMVGVLGAVVVITYLVLEPAGFFGQLGVATGLTAVWFGLLRAVVLKSDERAQVLETGRQLAYKIRQKLGGTA